MSEQIQHVPLADGFWWACKQPERLPTEYTNFAVGCQPCFVAFEACARSFPDMPMPLRGVDDVLVVDATAGEWLELMRASS